MTRRQFLQLVGGTAGVCATGTTMGYWGMFGTEGMKDLLQFLQSSAFGRKGYEGDFGLVDSHAHFKRGVNLQALIEIIFDSGVFMQTISGVGLAEYLTLGILGESVGSLEGIEKVFQDRHAIVLKKKDQELVFTQGEEFRTLFEGSGHGTLRDYHEMHIVVEGFDNVFGETSLKVLRAAETEGCPTTIAHPYTIPVRNARFLPANANEIRNLEKVCRDFEVFIEGGNAANTFYMVGTNALARDLGIRMRRPLVYNTDCHARENLDLVRIQVGKMGTLIPRFEIAGLNGKEIIHKKYELIASQGQRYGSPLGLIPFAQVMIAGK